MRVGRMRKRAQIQQGTVIAQQFGGEKVDWTTPTVIATVWAAFAPQMPGSGEQEHAQQQKNISRTLVTLRYSGSVPLTTRHRLVMNGRTFNIDNVANVDERNREWTVSCKEVT